ncbi:MAG TPA: hypothetical protein VLB84_02030 [Bacteroidia bacterium]|nr:hypothetical protein [Bacteroidia bacterium]
MAVRDRQKLITKIVAEVLGQPAETNKNFDWFINKHLKEHFGFRFNTIDKIFNTLNGDCNASAKKRTVPLDCDAYFGGRYNFIFEFDEFQHFSSARLKTLAHYPKELKLGFNVNAWENLCGLHEGKANKYRYNKSTIDFNFPGGRTAQRAYLDCFRDLLPEINGLNPTVRINEFEVAEIYSNNRDSYKTIEHLLKEKLS